MAAGFPVRNFELNRRPQDLAELIRQTVSAKRPNQESSLINSLTIYVGKIIRKVEVELSNVLK